MQRLALVDDKLKLPFKGGRGLCPMCGGVLVSACGGVRVHHWKHKSSIDCDNWSEPVGPWHLSWQDLVLPEFMEVTHGNHRADIVGNNNIVVELQSSPISSEDIEAREAFYGSMVWLFDATFRFSYLVSGSLAFFSFGRTKHIDSCKKKVFLDFGEIVVEVVTLQLMSRGHAMIKHCSGFGYVRSREWFVDSYLSEVKKDRICLDAVKTNKKGSSPWASRYPFHRMECRTLWYITDSKSEEIPAGTEYFLIKDRVWQTDEQPFYSDFVLKFKEIGGDWSVEELERMKSLLSGKVVILRGRLRVIPQKAKYIKPSFPYRTTLKLIDELKKHIQEGRIPILQETTFDILKSLGEKYSEAKGYTIKNSYKSEY